MSKDNSESFNTTESANATTATFQPHVVLLFLNKVLTKGPVAATEEYPQVILLTLAFFILPPLLNRSLDYIMSASEKNYAATIPPGAAYFSKDTRAVAMKIAKDMGTHGLFFILIFRNCLLADWRWSKGCFGI
jgi:hypothetical protein